MVIKLVKINEKISLIHFLTISEKKARVREIKEKEKVEDNKREDKRHNKIRLTNRRQIINMSLCHVISFTKFLSSSYFG